ncbi:hypothetical protein ACOJCM_01325 [Billgrantia sp. LNSP4103-1]|uniref:hypothetical protein n=1 Tax=Billgrantia sp. LNSP4103-1 TaxID=3410266 RepID=UPI00403F3750
MRMSLRLVTLAFLPVMLMVSGCSYSPARVTPEPLVVVDGSHRHYHEGKHRHRHYDDHYHDRRRYDGYRYHDRRHADRRRGRFCPPGHAMKGNC